MHHRFVSFAALFAAVIGGCSSSDFTVASTSDTGAIDDDAAIATDDGTNDGSSSGDTSPGDDTAPGDDAVVSSDAGTTTEAGIACAEPPFNPPIVYVDKRSTRPAKGTAECPFTAIAPAVAFVNGLGAGAHQVKVVGDVTTPLIYDEPMLVLKFQVSLVGDGPGKVVITGGSACESAVCMVVMEGGSKLEGVTLDAKNGAKVPLAMGANGLLTAYVKSTEIKGTASDMTPAIYVNGTGAAEIGPDMRIHDNAGHAILANAVSVLRVNGVAGTPNKLARNRFGIQVINGRLDLTGPTEITETKLHGVILLSPEKHVIDGLVAAGNVGTAVYVDTAASLKLRRSKLVANDTGLVFRFGTSNELDLGNLIEGGANTFGTKSAVNRRMGICLPIGRAGTSPARANNFNTCPPSALVMAETMNPCDLVPAGVYKDVYFAGPVSAVEAPLDTTGCASPN